MLSRANILIFALLLPLLLMGCHNTNTPESVAQQYLDALEHKDKEKTLALLTEKARKTMESSSANWESKTTFSSDLPKTATTKIEGEKAEVSFQQEKDNKSWAYNVLLRQESGQWRVYGLGIDVNKENLLTIDFENPESVSFNFGNLLKEAGKAIGEGLKSAGEALNRSLSTPQKR